ncbi:ATP phosphoribosyltransferase regulatory subunit [Clostridium sp. MB40-C1]|uniref:ATP phosphoribosyltransferase regulatory subunit n=1 Tax=Clostridium sp. MB40-C1 TaxID=3070996 RepID=UPI0027DEB72A|nr:ATP phosphoribosyltransferase regulatory subunit [Clostridium sp. MB40-C1]WMJ80282.1 ATP phosphoribosyltransferase regulatory subunit [Clostridium sp. MB40-C1]
MNKWKKYIPDGMKDILFDECRKKIFIQDNLRQTYKVSGFSQVNSPTLEFYDVFNFTNQPILQENMYKLFDSSGRILVLRPDMTTPIARIISTKVKDKEYPLKLCYTANVFRTNESLDGKLSEITQSGIEIIGSSNIRADAEVIITAIRSLKNLGVKNFKIDIGQSGFFKALIEDINMQGEDIEKLRKLIENKNYVSLRNFLKEKENYIDEESAYILFQLPQLFGDISVLDKAKNITKNSKALKAVNNIYDIYSVIREIGLENYISIDFGMIQNMNYYTGIIFRAYVEEIGECILSGGRYDNLTEEFGVNIPAIGFAINVDNILEVIKRQNLFSDSVCKKILIHCNSKYFKEAYRILDTIQDKDIICELSLYEDKKNSLNYAKNNETDTLISIEGNENINIINTHTEKYITVKLNKFINMFKEILELG